MMYQQVSEILAQANAGIETAEAHGIAVGMLVVDSRAEALNWLRVLVVDDNVLEDEPVLLDLFEETRLALNDDDEYSFDLLVPDDDETLVDQIEALRSWCQGFLVGVGYTRSTVEWPGDVGELMRDMIEFTKMDSDAAEEEDAFALMEIHEYVRAAVFTIKEYFLDTSKDS